MVVMRDNVTVIGFKELGLVWGKDGWGFVWDVDYNMLSMFLLTSGFRGHRQYARKSCVRAASLKGLDIALVILINHCT